MDKFIWLPEEEYQTTNCSWFEAGKNSPFALFGFRKEHRFEKAAVELELKLFADTKYFLTVNGAFLGVGPACPGGDYGNKKPMPVQYFSSYTVKDIGRELCFDIKVQLGNAVQTDMSCGRGGLWAEYTVTFADGTARTYFADESWRCRRETAYVSSKKTDLLLPQEAWRAAKFCENVWNLKPSPIENLVEERIEPLRICWQDEILDAEFDRIYAAYLVIEVESEAPFTLQAQAYETPSKMSGCYELTGQGRVVYRAVRLDSIGGVRVTGISREQLKAVYILSSHYPVHQQGSFACSDPVLNQIYEVGRLTAGICRQSLHLDSPQHQENLGCTGDYFIESLIDYYNFGDTALSRFDVVRTAEYLRMNEGKMFHTSYSLIWVSMLWDNYLYSGDRSVLEECRDALELLLARFAGYMGENGVIDDPPDYMFLDWVPVEEFNLHHPPKALGQSALNAFYYGALLAAEKIYGVLGLKNDCAVRAAALKTAFNRCFYDEERQLYHGGLNTPDEGDQWRPKNTKKRYFSVHTNALAALYGLCDDGKALMERTLNDRSLIQYQAYFAHFVLEALDQVGLFEKYGMQILHRWQPVVEECSKGLKEIWGDTPGKWDYSHAWGATAAYQLPAKLLGLKILEPGWKKIALSPNLYGLEWAEIRIPTPYGFIEGRLGKEHEIILPTEIRVQK